MPSYGFDSENYIAVEDRIAALKDEHPESAILTEVVGTTGDLAKVVIKATIYLSPGHDRPSATGLAEATSADGDKWLEKCETVAIGRACANLGMARFRGTPRMSAEENEAWQARQESRAQQRPAQAQPRPQAGISGDHPSDKQLRYLASVCREAGIPVIDPEGLSKLAVSRLIDDIKEGRHPAQRSSSVPAQADPIAAAAQIFDADVDEIPF